MRVNRLFGFLLSLCFLGSLASAADIDSRQSVIDKELPGFTIVPSDLISPIEDSPDHPRRQTVITADFNGDGKRDFAAIVVKTNGKALISQKGQPLWIAVCLSSSGKRHDCGLLGKSGSFNSPIGFYLEAVKPGKLHCYDAWITPVDSGQNPPGNQKELGDMDILIKTFSIGSYPTMGNTDMVYVYQSRKRFLSCPISG
ncbi:MAG: hypothetical protein ACYCZ4_08565 [Sulfuricella sp.]